MAKKDKFLSWKNWGRGILLAIGVSFIGYLSMIVIQNTSSTLSWIFSVLIAIFVPPIYSLLAKEIYGKK